MPKNLNDGSTIAPQVCANVERWMDWQATEFNNVWCYVFPALARKNPAIDACLRV